MVPFLFNIYTNDLQEVMCTLIKPADHTKLERPVSALKCRAVFQLQDLDRLEEWPEGNCMKVCLDRCENAALERKKPTR